MDTWHERTSPLDQVLPTDLGEEKRGRDQRKEEREKEKERERGRDFRERDSNFSLDFPVIGPANSGKVRSKVGLHCKSYACVPDLWNFYNSRR